MWIKSKLYEEVKEQDENASVRECFNGNPLEWYLDDLIELYVTLENYLKLIELCDYLMVTNVDVVVDKIVECFGIQIIHEFGEFYRYNSERLQVHDRKSLRVAIKSYCKDPDECYRTYGFPAYWDVSKIEDMSYMFHYDFNADLSMWDVSGVTNMDEMFICAKFNGDISKWDLSKVKKMKLMFYESVFEGAISNWDVSNAVDMSYMFAKGKFNGDI